MNQYFHLLLIRPLKSFEFHIDDLGATEDSAIEVDLNEGIVRLPNGNIVLAISFVECAERIKVRMREWQNEVGGQRYPLPFREAKKYTILRELGKFLELSNNLRYTTGDRRDWDSASDAEGYHRGIIDAMSVVKRFL